jgi:hypothetical protein
MADYNPSVALGINPPDPNQGLNTLSKIMGLGQQGLGIREQQQKLQQQQIETQRQQGLQNFFQNWDPSEHDGPDGTTDMESARNSPAYKAAGLAKPDIDLRLSQIKQAQLQNKQSLTTLNGDNLAQFSRVVQSLAADDDVKADAIDPVTGVNAGRAKVDAALSNFAKLGPDAARVARIYTPVTEHAPPGKLISGVTALAAQAQDISAQQSQTNPQLTSVSRGGSTDIYNINKATGLQPNQKPVQSVATTIPPGFMMGPNGSLLRVSDAGISSPNVTGASGNAAPVTAPNKLQPLQRPGLNAPKADQDRYNSQIAAATQHVQDVSAAANDLQNGVGPTRYRNDQIQDILNSKTFSPTGPGAAQLNWISSKIPGESGDAFQKIGHYLAQNSAAVAQKMGVPNTNMGAESAAAAAGNTSQNRGALLEVTKVNDAMNSALDLYNRGIAKATNNGSDPSKVAAYRQAFGQNFDMNVLRYDDALRRNDRAEIDSLTKKLGPKGMQALGAKRTTLHSLSDTGDLP